MIFKQEKAKELKDKAVDARRFIEKDWYENSAFLEGKHYVAYDSKNKTLRKIEKSQGQVQRTINNIRKYRDSMVRLVTNDEPRVEIRYTGYDEITDQMQEGVEVIDHLIKEKWRTKHLDNLSWMTVRDGLQYSLGANEIYWDGESRDGLGDFKWRRIDLWGLWFDPEGKMCLETGEFDGDWMVRSFMTSREALESNPKYKEIPASGRMEVSDVKTSLDDLLYSNSTANRPTDSVVVDVWYIKETKFEKLENEEGETYYKKYCKFKIKEMVDETVIWEDDSDLDEYPIKIYKPEVETLVFNRPKLSDQIDPNKTIDQIYSSMEEYARTMIHGRILRNDKTQMSTISTRSGQVVTYKGAREPKEWRMSGIDSSLFSLMEKAEQSQQAMAQIGDGTLGGGNSSSGLELGLRKATDLENASEPAGTLGRYLALIIKTILKLYVKHLNTSMPITYQENGEEKIKMVISKNVDNPPKGTAMIEAFDDIEVKVVPKSAFSDLALQQDVMQLAQMGAVDMETTIETFMQGKTREVLARVRRVKLEAKGIAGEVEEAEQEAQAENQALLKGGKLPEPTKWKNKQAQGVSLVTNGQFLEDLIKNGSSDSIKKKAEQLIRQKAKMYGYPLKEKAL